MAAPEDVDLTIKWTNKEIHLTLDPQTDVAGLKRALEEHTSVSTKRMKLIGLKSKVTGKPATDDLCLADLQPLKPNQKIMMMGSVDSQIESLAAQAETQPHIQDDFEDDAGVLDIDIRRRPEVQEKLERRIKSAVIKRIQPPRPGKKLLVIDIDYTIYALDSFAENAAELARPHLHEFLETSYMHYDIIVWSATGMKWIEVKLKELGISTHPMYKITACLDFTGMLTVETSEKGVFDCKPLQVIWENFDEYHPGNTIMLDDLRRNYILNPQNGLVIRPYRKAHRMKHTDLELLYLKHYLLKIAELESLADLNHDKWEKYIKHEIRALMDKDTDDKADNGSGGGQTE